MATATELYELQKKNLPRVAAAENETLALLGFDMNEVGKWERFFLIEHGVKMDEEVCKNFPDSSDPFWADAANPCEFAILALVKSWTPAERKNLHDRIAHQAEHGRALRGI